MSNILKATRLDFSLVKPYVKVIGFIQNGLYFSGFIPSFKGTVAEMVFPEKHCEQSAAQVIVSLG